MKGKNKAFRVLLVRNNIHELSKRGSKQIRGVSYTMHECLPLASAEPVFPGTERSEAWRALVNSPNCKSCRPEDCLFPYHSPFQGGRI